MTAADRVRATRAQELWWAVHQDHQDATIGLPRRLDGVDHVVVAARRLRVPLDVTALERCLRLVSARHEALRTGLVAGGDALYQQVEPEPDLAWQVIDLFDRPAEQALVEVEAAARGEARCRFDPARPRFRAVLARLAGDDSVLVITVLHSMFDDFSHQLLVGELRALYAMAVGAPLARELPEPVPFRRFSDWQLGWRADERLRAQHAYWRRKLDGYCPEIALPVLRPRAEVVLDTRSSLRVAVSPRQWKAVLAVAGAERVTPYAVTLAVISAVLAEHAGQREVAIATVYGNRRQPWTRSIIGLVVNTLIVRTSVADNPTLRVLIKRVARDWLDALASGELPFDELADELGRSRLPGRGTPPAYEALVNFHVPATLNDDDRPSWMEPWSPPDDERPAAWAGCLLHITLGATADGGVAARFGYTRELLADDVVAAIAARFHALLSTLSEVLELAAARLGSRPPGEAVAAPGEVRNAGERR
jgi:hypothetical protein